MVVLEHHLVWIPRDEAERRTMDDNPEPSCTVIVTQ